MSAQIIPFPVVKRPVPAVSPVADIAALVNAFCDGFIAAGEVAKAAPVAAPALVRFEVGKTYQCRSIGDWDCVFSFEVVARTAKRMTLRQHGKTFVRGIYECDGAEACKPNGTYSMCAVIRADKTIY